MIYLLIATFAGLILFEVPGLIKKKSWRELVIFSILMCIAFAISLLQMLHIEYPNPVRDTQYFVQKLLHLSYE